MLLNIPQDNKRELLPTVDYPALSVLELRNAVLNIFYLINIFTIPELAICIFNFILTDFLIKK